MNSNFIQIHPRDNVLVALTNLQQGATVPFNGHEIVLQENIPAKHKFFIDELEQAGFMRELAARHPEALR